MIILIDIRIYLSYNDIKKAEHDDMNFVQLEYFVAICENSSVSKAAEKLFITQSALSQQLIRLEKELGTQLFNRYTNSITLTASGELFLESARTMLFEYNNVRSMITNDDKQLTIVVTKTKSFITLSYLLSRFASQYPQINIKIREVDSYQVEETLHHGEGDLGFCYNADDNGLVYHIVGEERILLAVSPNHTVYERLSSDGIYQIIPFEQIADAPFIVGTSGYLREYTQALFRAHHHPLHTALETANPALLHLLVAANIGCGFVGEISTWLSPNRIPPARYCLLEGEEDKKMTIALAHHRRRHITPAMRLFIEYAKEYLGSGVLIP